MRGEKSRMCKRECIHKFSHIVIATYFPCCTWFSLFLDTVYCSLGLHIRNANVELSPPLGAMNENFSPFPFSDIKLRSGYERCPRLMG